MEIQRRMLYNNNVSRSNYLIILKGEKKEKIKSHSLLTDLIRSNEQKGKNE